MYVQQVDLIYQMEFVLIVSLQNTGITKIKHVKDVLILSYMTKKNNNVSVQITNLTYSKEDVFPAIYHIIGIQISANVSHVHLHFNTTPKLEGVYVLQIGLTWSIINVSLVNYLITGIKRSETVINALKPSSMILTKEVVSVQFYTHFYKMANVHPVPIPTIGIQ